MARFNGYDDYETGFETWDYNKLSKADKVIYDKKATVHSEKEVAKIVKDIKSNKKEVKKMVSTVTKSKPVTKKVVKSKPATKKSYSAKERKAYTVGYVNSLSTCEKELEQVALKKLRTYGSSSDLKVCSSFHNGWSAARKDLLKDKKSK